MSMKYMKVKRITIPFITLLLLVGQLTGCVPMTSQEAVETMDEYGRNVEIDVITMDNKISKDTDTIKVDDKSYEVSYDNTTKDQTKQVIQETVEELQDMPAEDMYKLFEKHYNDLLDTPEEIVRSIYGENANTFEEMHIAMELAKLNDTKATKFLGYKIPDNLNDLYIEWRESYVQNEIQVEDKAVEPFDAVDEIVYAINDVNIRGFYNIESEKKGLLSYGQSIRRVGIGKEEADGWSKVLLDDGSAAYIKSDYLSTSKPAVKSSSQGSKASTVTNNNQNNSNSNKNNSDEQSSCDATPTGNCDAGACDIAPSRQISICTSDAAAKTHLNDPNGDYTDNNDYSDLVGLN